MYPHVGVPTRGRHRWREMSKCPSGIESQNAPRLSDERRNVTGGAAGESVEFRRREALSPEKCGEDGSIRGGAGTVQVCARWYCTSRNVEMRPEVVVETAGVCQPSSSRQTVGSRYRW